MLGRLVAPLRAALATSCSHLATLSSQLAAAAAVRSLHSSAPHHSVTVAIRRLARTVAAPSLHRHLLPDAAAPAAAPRRAISLETIHRRLQNPRPRIVKRPLDGAPQMKGVVLKTLIKKPKKPNSANRRCCLVRLSSGKEMVAYVPGEGHNLQEHNIVLVRVGRLRDVPGVKLKCIRGKYDLSHVVKRTQD